MTPSELSAILKQTAGADLDGIPLYVGFSSRLPESLRTNSDCTFGFTSQVLDLALQSTLDATGDWQGRGAAICINDLAIAQQCESLAADDPDLAAELIDDRILAVGLHELAHVLEHPVNTAPPKLPGMSQFREREISRWCKAPMETFAVPWELHDAHFLRMTAHVVHRAEQRAGVDRISRHLVVDGSVYGLSHFANYCDALGGELDSFEGSIAELRELPPPAAFVELWQSDLHSFANQLASISGIVNALVSAHTLYPRA